MKISRVGQSQMEINLTTDELAVICNCMWQACSGKDPRGFKMKIGIEKDEFLTILDKLSDLIPTSEHRNG